MANYSELNQQQRWTQPVRSLMSKQTERTGKLPEILAKLQNAEGELEKPLTCYYQKEGKLIGSYFCGDTEDDFVLFINQDYPDSSLIIDLISQHCQFFDEAVFVYSLDNKAITRYETLTPMNYVIVDL